MRKNDGCEMKSKNTTSNATEKKRLCIGVLVDWLEEEYQLNLVSGVESYLKSIDADMICLEGGGLRSGRGYEDKKNYIYQLISRENVDGLIILASAIGHYVSLEEMYEFCESFAPIPVLNIGMNHPKIPSIMLDYSGFEGLIDHLLEIHFYKKFAFISGPATASGSIERLKIFRRALEKHNVEFNEELLIYGNYTTESGILAIKELLDKHKGRFEAVVSANDHMALGALEELQRQKVKVPEEIAMIGFDNIELSQFCVPPMTTVSQSTYQQGQLAAELLSKKIKGKSIKINNKLSIEPVFRESCGCLPGAYFDSKEQFNELEMSRPSTTLHSNRKKVYRRILSALKKKSEVNPCERMEEAIKKLLSSFLLYMEDSSSTDYKKNWNCLISESQNPICTAMAWQNVLSEFRIQVLPYLGSMESMLKAENIWHQIRLLISEKMLIKEKYQQYLSTLETQALNWLRDELLVTMTEDELMSQLATRLPMTGISCCFIALQDQEISLSKEEVRLILAFNEKGRIQIPEMGQAFTARDLYPRDMLSDQFRRSLLVTPVSYSDEHNGYMVLDMAVQDDKLYGALRRLVSSTLLGVKLMKTVQDQTASLQEQKQQLTHTLENLRKSMGGFIQTMSMTVEMRDPYTAGHQARVSDLAKAIAREMGMPEDKIEGIGMAGILHDLGKIYVPSEILNKPGELRSVEFELIKYHSEVAYNILKSIDFPWPIAKIILQHHERLDGSGYPNELKGNEIMSEARILCVADVVEAMATHRPYRPALGLDKALQEITDYKGKRFDTHVVEACLRLFNEKGYHFKEV